MIRHPLLGFLAVVVIAAGIPLWIDHKNAETACKRAEVTRQNQIDGLENTIRSSRFLSHHADDEQVRDFWTREYRKRLAQRGAPNLQPITC
jgi:hypothetical protein